MEDGILFRSTISQGERGRRNREATQKGYSACHRCHDTWDWKMKHVVDFPGGGGFALCEECWRECTPQERARYYDELVDLWNSQSTRLDQINRNELRRKQMRDAILA